MELKVWVEGIQRIVCGVTDKTSCQDVVYALAHATGKTGRFTLIERWRNNERLLAPQERPLKVLQKWGDYNSDVQFILQRSALDPKGLGGVHPLSPQLQRAKYSSSSGLATHGKAIIPFEAVWKAPPILSKDPARLSPDSGRGSDKTGSDTSNSNSDKEHYSSQVKFNYPPAYRPPPSLQPSPSGNDPPPYRAPPPPPGIRFRPPLPTSPTMGVSQMLRIPHYSPPPVHRTSHLSRHPSKTSLLSQPLKRNNNHNYHNLTTTIKENPSLEYNDLYNLVVSQQSTLQSQQADIKKLDSELNFLEYKGFSSRNNFSSDSTSSSVDVVSSEIRRLEDVAGRNEDELRRLGIIDSSSIPDDEIIGENLSLKTRLSATQQEIHKTKLTLRHLSDEMRTMSLEKNKQRELDLMIEIDKYNTEIKNLQKSSQEGSSLSQMLTREIQDTEEQINSRKAEVERLIKEMREANMESLIISPPEESKQFLEGPPKPSSSRKMLGSPRALETAVPTAKNPHGVWV